MDVFTETYQFLFISSIIFMVSLLYDLFIKMMARFVQKKSEVVFNMTQQKKIIFWISLSIILSYLI